MEYRYNIEWDELLEAYRLSEPQRDYAVAAANVLLAIGFVAVAACLFAILGAAILQLELLLILMGAAVLLGGLWDITGSIFLSKRKFQRGMRGIFENESKSQHKFSFDDQTWRALWGGEAREASWDKTLAAVESESVITIQTSDSFVVIPKRVLSPSSVEALRRLAIGPIDDRCSFRVTLQEYLLTEICSLWRRSPIQMATFTFAGLGIGATLAFSVQANNGVAGVVTRAIAPAYVVLITVIGPLGYYSVRYLTRAEFANIAWDGGYSTRGVRVDTRTAQQFGAWKLFPRFRETKRAFLIYTDDLKYHILPKSCLSAEQKHGLKQLLEEMLPQG